ncbi:hypothetical protein D3C79_1080300 [compost metagenome]
MKMLERELMKLLGYNLYCFYKDYQLTESEMHKLLILVIESGQYKKEYGIEGED